MAKYAADRLLEVRNRLGEAAIDPAAWPELMEQLCAAVGASGAALLQSDARTPDIPRTASVDESFHRYFAEGWHQRDARQKCVPLFLAGKKVVTDQDICTPEEIRRSDFYQDLLASFGYKWFAGIGFRSDSALWVLALQRSPREGPFDGREVRMLARLSAQLGEVATLSASVGRIALTSVANALDYLGHAAIALDRRGMVIGVNTAADRLFDDELCIRNRQLFVRDQRGRSAIDAFVDQMRTAPEACVLSFEPTVIKRRANSPVVVRVMPVHGAARTPFLGARAILLLRDLSPRPGPAANMLARLFGLTPAQTKLALVISSGVSLEHAAEELGITRETARNHLKAVFSKTGTHRQGELVALLSRLTV